MNELEQRYGFASQLAALSDHQLVARFNGEVGNRGCGTARMYFLACLADELRSRDIDSALAFSDSGLDLRQKLSIAAGKLVADE